MKQTTFFSQVYHIVRRIPAGKVMTYGQIARLIGRPQAARYVGFALHANKTPAETPCHRVVNRTGSLAPNFAFGGAEIQKQLLLKEGIEFSEQGQVLLNKHQA